MSNSGNSDTPTVVLVHAAFADGSGWQGVYKQLTEAGHRVAVVQNPTISVEGDVAATNLVLDAQSEPVILVGHSYGGVVITRRRGLIPTSRRSYTSQRSHRTPQPLQFNRAQSSTRWKAGVSSS